MHRNARPGIARILGAHKVFSLIAPAVLAAVGCFAMRAYGQIAVRNQGYIPYSDAPINYRSDDLHDPVAKLQQQLDQGKASLEYDSEHGYLRSVLKLLNVPIDSQTLVFLENQLSIPEDLSRTPPGALFQR